MKIADDVDAIKMDRMANNILGLGILYCYLMDDIFVIIEIVKSLAHAAVIL